MPQQVFTSWLRAEPSRKRAASAGAVCVLGASVAFVHPWRSERDWPTATAREGRFVETLTEGGTIAAARLMLYGSTIAGGPAKIVEIAPEGRSVAAGDLLIRFDATVFQQELAKEAAALEQAEAEVRRAGEELRLEMLQSRAASEDAREGIRHADNELADETDGAGQLRVAETAAAAAEATREVARTRTAYEDLKPLLAEGFITRTELDRAEQQWQRAAEQAALADLKRKTLQQYSRPAALSRAQSAVQIARDTLTRTEEQAAARRVHREAAVAQTRARQQEIRARMALIEDRLTRVVVRAGAPGLVVYRDLFFGSDRRKPQVGDEVWPNQPIIALPDSSQLAVETKIREADLHKVSASQQVFVSVDAYPDLRLRANVALVGALAAQDETRAGTKHFPVTIRLLDADPRLRSGMTARVDIEVASIARAVILPARAVFEREGQPHCVVLRRGNPQLQPVTVDGDNGLEVAIRQGVKPGERVLLTDPSSER
jgi:HlyD family secretion protein